MLRLVIFCVSLAMVAVGTIAHFHILTRLEQSGIDVKYFANLTDNLRVYRAYRSLAKERHWSIWPMYGVSAGFAGVVLAAFVFILDSPLPWIVKWFR